MSSTPFSPSPTPTPPPAKKPTKAQSPFLVQKKYLAAQAAKKDAAPKKEKGKRVGAGPGTVGLTVLMMVLGGLVVSSVVSYGLTRTWFWGDDLGSLSKVFGGGNAMSTGEKVFTVEELAKHDGSNASYPPYIAITGIVYDVSAGAKTYGPGGSYHFFAGKDATRAYITGCFETHLTHDLRGIDQGMLDSFLKGWTDFFAGSEKYFRVGTVDLPEIDPASPLPEPCTPSKSH